ncbi:MULTISPECIES: DUF6511 domain-containing protein [unclassified Mesorhizobium]|uniref:DUF6511 domain-containing protein n=1 Tax=unclassified Mesorhizobium TaxID=325217 RepID=UPI001125E60E|nr:MULTISPECIES: DUF6511 domain-containing protein [unclassified Mesorhizobium]TPJ86937.1 hypothetical protein FJ489_30755 [Mesorhizobium sp. B2-5-12]TPK19160.1 hypothetical protein FJ562_31160 [Mesorhizobium sp. B2-5-6]
MTTPNPHPNVCHVCGMTGCGLGIGFSHSRDADPKWLCIECSLIIEDIKKVKRLDVYELKAREGGVEAAAPVVEAYGTDLAEYTDEQAAMLAGAIWKGCAARLRELIRDGSAPF